MATSETATFTSDDGGGRWRRLEAPVGLIAWPSADRLFVMDASGQVSVAAAPAVPFQTVGAIGGEPAAFHAEGAALFAARHDGAILRSTDEGRSWQQIVAP